MNKTLLQRELEDEFHRSIENILIERYYGPRQMSYADIAFELGIGPGTVGLWMRQLGVNQKAVAFRAMHDPIFLDGITGSKEVKALLRNAS